MVSDGPPVRHRSWAEVRWRQFRNAPRPVVRAVAVSLTTAIVAAVAYLAYDIAIARGMTLPGVVPQPTGSGTVRRRSGWSAALGFFAAVPIAWLVMVVALQVIRPWFG